MIDWGLIGTFAFLAAGGAVVGAVIGYEWGYNVAWNRAREFFLYGRGKNLLVVGLVYSTALPAFGGEPRDFIFFVSPLPPPPPVQPPAPIPPKATATPKVNAPLKSDTSVGVEQVASVLGSCVRCHSAGDAKPKTKPIVLFNEAGDFNPAVTAAEVYAAVKDDEMPLSGPKLSARDKDLIRRWSGVTKSEVTQ